MRSRLLVPPERFEGWIHGGTDGFRGMERPQPGCGVHLCFKKAVNPWVNDNEKVIYVTLYRKNEVCAENCCNIA